MKFKKEDMIALFHEDYSDEFAVIEEGKWKSEGKFEWRALIFSFEDKFYEIIFSRSGSHFTDWYYDHEDWPEMVEATEVRQVEKTVVAWEAV